MLFNKRKKNYVLPLFISSIPELFSEILILQKSSNYLLNPMGIFQNIFYNILKFSVNFSEPCYCELFFIYIQDLV